MEKFDVIIVMPVGPNTKVDYIIDTLNSYYFYTSSSYKVILIDDSHQGIGKQFEGTEGDVDVLYTQKPAGAMAGLYMSLCMAYNYAVNNYDFKVLLKLDTDALVIGRNPELDAIQLFENNPVIGIAGQYPRDYQGNLWDVGWPRDRIVNGTMTWKFIKRPLPNVLLRKLYIKAINNGYRTGESVFGGAYFMSRTFLLALEKNKLLPNILLGKLNMGEDHLFGLLAKAIGFDLGDLPAPGLPFACAWKGLPASPEELKSNKKKIIHSTRNWMNMSEDDIRLYYNNKRTEDRDAQNLSELFNSTTIL